MKAWAWYQWTLTIKFSLSANLLKVLNYFYPHLIIFFVYVDIWKHGHIDTREQPSVLLLRSCHTCFLRQGLSLSWILPHMPGWLTSESQSPVCLCLSTETASTHHCGFFTEFIDLGLHPILSCSIQNASLRTSSAGTGVWRQASWTEFSPPEPTPWKESTDPYESSSDATHGLHHARLYTYTSKWISR